VALVAGTVAGADDVLVHVHTECLSGDVFGSLACGCGRALDDAMASVTARGRGVVIYVRAAGTVRACTLLGRVDETARRASADVASSVLEDLGVDSVELLGDDTGAVQVPRRHRPVTAAACALRAAAG
jgi:3,4-dihydroxy 2-butanone 4-phosphate synthase/GTP cyclohydrolase II